MSNLSQKRKFPLHLIIIGLIVANLVVYTAIFLVVRHISDKADQETAQWRAENIDRDCLTLAEPTSVTPDNLSVENEDTGITMTVSEVVYNVPTNNDSYGCTYGTLLNVTLSYELRENEFQYILYDISLDGLESTLEYSLYDYDTFTDTKGIDDVLELPIRAGESTSGWVLFESPDTAEYEEEVELVLKVGSDVELRFLLPRN